MKRRRFTVAAVVLAGATGIATACSFPDPQLVPDVPGDGDASSSSSGNTTQNDGGIPEDASLVDSVFAIDGNENVDPDGAAQEASVAPEAGPPIDAATCPVCDCDEDGVRSNNASCSNPGKDCNDLDPFIPHDGFVASKPVGHNGDWDCDGKVTKQFPVNVNCGLLANCNAAGFTGDPACGVAADFVTCKPSVLPLVLCDVKTTETVIQGCR